MYSPHYQNWLGSLRWGCGCLVVHSGERLGRFSLIVRWSRKARIEIEDSSVEDFQEVFHFLFFHFYFTTGSREFDCQGGVRGWLRRFGWQGNTQRRINPANPSSVLETKGWIFYLKLFQNKKFLLHSLYTSELNSFSFLFFFGSHFRLPLLFLLLFARIICFVLVAVSLGSRRILCHPFNLNFFSF